ncbi:hypothetical protein UNSWDHB_46 [Dehalobacter sp. UNSWDHB]|nr:hypothetical protein UNSWDHB_46 [Dehalobacter sp. UNSWDHB]
MKNKQIIFDLRNYAAGWTFTVLPYPSEIKFKISRRKRYGKGCVG